LEPCDGQLLAASPKYCLGRGALLPGVPPILKSPMPRDALEPESKIADIVHRLLRDRSVDREFGVEDNLRDVGLTSLDMTSLVFAVEAEFAIAIPDRAITPANFTSVASVGRLVRTLIPHHAAQSELSSDSPG
jgi:acyl carrier protein